MALQVIDLNYDEAEGLEAALRGSVLKRQRPSKPVKPCWCCLIKALVKASCLPMRFWRLVQCITR
jgi:hypothetical protein